MKEKMAKSRAKGRGGWDDTAQCSIGSLQQMLMDHISKGDPVDVGNFAMMLHQRGGGTAPAANTIKDAMKAGATSKDWVDDFDHENGCYSCVCSDCKTSFIGHKGRMACKQCAAARAKQDKAS